MRGEGTAAQIAALLIGLRVKGETADEVTGAAQALRAAMLRLTQLFNITGHPAITLPCGATPTHLPVGAQMVGRRGGTSDVLDLAAAVEGDLGPGTSR